MTRCLDLRRLGPALAASLIVSIIGCGGNGGNGGTGNKFADFWVGIVRGSDGTDPNALLSISTEGAITGEEEVSNGSLSAYGVGSFYTMTGRVTQWGTFTMTGSSPGLPDRTFSGTVSIGTDGALVGRGTMSSGGAPVTITFALSGSHTSANGTGGAG